MTALIALLIAAFPPPAADPIASAAARLTAVIEEDGRPDVPLRAMATRACRTTLRGRARQWTIDWRRPATITREDTFVFVDAAPVRIAIVADASRPDQAAGLDALTAAMRSVASRCRSPT